MKMPAHAWNDPKKTNAALNKNFKEKIKKHDDAKQTTDGPKTLQINSIIDIEPFNQECIYNTYISKLEAGGKLSTCVSTGETRRAEIQRKERNAQL